MYECPIGAHSDAGILSIQDVARSSANICSVNELLAGMEEETWESSTSLLWATTEKLISEEALSRPKTFFGAGLGAGGIPVLSLWLSGL